MPCLNRDKRPGGYKCWAIFSRWLLKTRCPGASMIRGQGRRCGGARWIEYYSGGSRLPEREVPAHKKINQAVVIEIRESRSTLQKWRRKNTTGVPGNIAETTAVNSIEKRQRLPMRYPGMAERDGIRDVSVSNQNLLPAAVVERCAAGVGGRQQAGLAGDGTGLASPLTDTGSARPSPS